MGDARVLRMCGSRVQIPGACPGARERATKGAPHRLRELETRDGLDAKASNVHQTQNLYGWVTGRTESCVQFVANFESDIIFVGFAGSRRPGRDKLTFRPVGRESPRKLEGQFARRGRRDPQKQNDTGAK